MGDQNGDPGAPETGGSSAAPPAAQAQAPAYQSPVPAAQAQAPAYQSPVPAAQAQAPAYQSPVPAAQSQAPADRTQAPADRAQAPAAQAQVPAAQAQAPAAQAQVPAAQAQALAAQALALATQAQALATRAQALATQAQALVAPNIDVDAAEKSVFAYKEIANLHDINLHYPIHKLALKEWQRREAYLSNSESRREVRSAELTNQIYNIFGWFAVFQGVVLTAVSQLTQTTHAVPLCGKIWFPIVLSGFATGATIVGIQQKITSLQSLEETIHTDRQAKTEVAKRALRLRSEGPQSFKFHKHTDNSRLATQAKPFWQNRFLVILFLVIFTGIFILSYFVILCDTWVVRKWDGGLHR